MDKSKLECQVLRIINEYLPQAITKEELDCQLVDKGLDSLAFVEVIVSLEQEYGLVWPPEYLAMDVMDTAGAILGVLRQQFAQNAPA